MRKSHTTPKSRCCRTDPPHVRNACARGVHHACSKQGAAHRLSRAKTPSSRTTPTGKKLSQYSVAVTRRWKAGDESKEATDWFNVEVWGTARRAQPASTSRRAASSTSKAACRQTATRTRAVRPSTSPRSWPASCNSSTASRPRSPWKKWAWRRTRPSTKPETATSQLHIRAPGADRVPSAPGVFVTMEPQRPSALVRHELAF